MLKLDFFFFLIKYIFLKSLIGEDFVVYFKNYVFGFLDYFVRVFVKVCRGVFLLLIIIGLFLKKKIIDLIDFYRKF